MLRFLTLVVFFATALGQLSQYSPAGEDIFTIDGMVASSQANEMVWLEFDDPLTFSETTYTSFILNARTGVFGVALREATDGRQFVWKVDLDQNEVQNCYDSPSGSMVAGTALPLWASGPDYDIVASLVAKDGFLKAELSVNGRLYVSDHIPESFFPTSGNIRLVLDPQGSKMSVSSIFTYNGDAFHTHLFPCLAVENFPVYYSRATGSSNIPRTWEQNCQTCCLPTAFVYEGTFVKGERYGPGHPNYDDWFAFLDLIDPSLNYASITIVGSELPEGRTADEPGAANQLAEALYTKTRHSVVSNGILWTVATQERCDLTGVELSANNQDYTSCVCALGPIVRPSIERESNWGGLDPTKSTCQASSQTMAIVLVLENQE